jgi:hypothetical protein
VPLPIATKLLNYYYYVYGTVATQLNVRMNSNKKCQIKPIATNTMASCNKKKQISCYHVYRQKCNNIRKWYLNKN